MGAAESSPQTKEARVELGEECARRSDVYKLWTRVHACTRNSTKGTLFVKEQLDGGGGSDSKQYFENGIKSLRQLRHPCILQYVDSQILPGEARLFTERVQVLDLCIDSLSSIEIRSGLRSILDALIFLHSTASMSHNAVCPSSIFVAPDGSWRLGGLEFARKYAGEKRDDHLLLSPFFKAVKPAPFSPPEDQSAMQSGNPTWARDAFGLGRLIEYALPHLEKEMEKEEEGGHEEVLESLRAAALSLCSSCAIDRGRLEESREMPAFCNPLSEVEHFVRTIQTKTEEEKEDFFRRALPLISSLPSRVIGRRLTRLLLSRYIILEARAHETFLPALLRPLLPPSDVLNPSGTLTGLLPLALFRDSLLPECTHVLRVRDLHVRLAILRHFHTFAPHYTREQLLSTIIPEILLGLEDADDRMVAATLEAMAVLVPLVGADAVLQRRGKKGGAEGTPALARTHRERARIFIDGTPKASMPIADASVSPTVGSQLLSRAPPEVREPPLCLGGGTTHTPTIQPQMPLEAAAESSVAGWDDDGEEDEGWNDEWEERKEIKGEINEQADGTGTIDEQMVTVLKGTVGRTASGSGGMQQRAEKKSSSEIGSEFALKVTVRSEIDDLFADMEPEIKTGGSILSQLEEMAAAKKSIVSPPSKSTVDEETRKDTVATARLAFTSTDEADSWGGGDEWGLDED